MFGSELHWPLSSSQKELALQMRDAESGVCIFESVKRLVIDKYDKFDNRMFPNLEEIQIDPSITDLEAVGPMLIHYGKLRYVFSAGMKEECVVPKCIKEIGYEAFAHTTCKKIIFENPDVDYHINAFDDSAWIQQNVSCLMIGKKVYRCKPIEKKIVISDDALEYDVRAFDDVKSEVEELVVPFALSQENIDNYRKRFVSSVTKRMKINRNEYVILDILGSHSNKRGNRNGETSYLLGIRNYTIKNTKNMDLSTLHEFPMLERVTVSEGNECYRTVDGVLYSSQMDDIYFCPPKRNRPYQIPNSVDRICCQAFKSSQLKRLVIPPTVRFVEASAFEACQLKEITLHEGTAHDVFEGFEEVPRKIHVIGRQGNTFTLVHKTATRDSYRAMLSEQWNKGVFDEETATLIWFKGYLVNRNQMKYQFALEKLKEPSPKQEYLDYVKSFSMQKAHEFIKMHKEDELIALIQRIHPFLETHVLQDLLCKATDENLATSSAYLLECLKTRDHKPNRSLEL